MSSITKASRWQADRAARLHGAFSAVQSAVTHEGAPLVASLESLAVKLDGTVLSGGKVLRTSTKTLTRLWYVWQAGKCKAAALLPKYKSPKHVRAMPDLLTAEVQKLASAETGGRDKHGKGVEGTGILKQLQGRWMRGESLPGVGTWQEWWAVTYPALPLPATAPEFPWSAKTIQRKRGSRAVQAMGNLGDAAARKHMPTMKRDYSKLRRCELYMLDDVRLDLVGLDEITGRVVDIVCYIMIEVASRSIVGFILKPKHALKAEDVDELVAYCLQADGFGIGTGYQTHIWFERGTVACTEAAQLVLEAGSDNGIKVHRTSMDGDNFKWIGSAADRASGHAAGKAVIESFNRNLHRRLLHLPGQRGNHKGNQPANLGVGDAVVKNPSKSDADTIRANAERLGQFKLTAMVKGENADLILPLLTVSQLHREVAKALKDHNTTRGHQMQGFHTITEAEVAPGVWKQVANN